MKKLIVSLSLAVLCLSTSVVFSQTTFTGANSNVWAEAGNWDNGLPAAGNNATIPAGLIVVNFGTINNEGGITNNGLINNNNYGTIENYGGIENGGRIFNGGDFSNIGTIFNNNGTITNIYWDFSNIGTIENYGTIENVGGIENFGTINQCGIWNGLGVEVNPYTSCATPGCTDTSACNYAPTATEDDNSCEFTTCADCCGVPYGDGTTCDGVCGACSDDTSCEDACGVPNGDNSTCSGCTYATATNYASTATIDDGTCVFPDITLDNQDVYDEGLASACLGDFTGDGNVNVSDLGGFLGAFGTECSTLSLLGCTDVTAFNYDALANTDDDSCIAFALGCTDVTAFNYDALANTDDDSCIAVALGCRDVTAFNYDALANTDDDSCIAFALGCTDVTAFNYDYNANTEDDSCIAVALGCTVPLYTEYDTLANTNDGSCATLIVNGCTDPTALNYDASANTDDGSCIAVVNGCTNSTATNYNTLANTDDGSCIYPPFSGAIGDTYQGGIVFWLDGNGGGLIAAPSDQSCCSNWNTAVSLCNNLILGGYSDWFLPSKDELNLMYQNIGQGNVVFVNSPYWSSTETSASTAWAKNLSTGLCPNNHKCIQDYVRAVRAF